MSKHIARRPLPLRRIGAAVAVLAAASATGLATVPNATATGGDEHKIIYICHPVGGAGETGTGWTIVGPDKATSHIDLDLYFTSVDGGGSDPDVVYWKHEQDGRHDEVVTDDNPLALTHSCPGETPVVHGLTVDQTISTSFNKNWIWSIDKTVSTPDLYLYAPAAAGPHSGSVNWQIDASAQPDETDETVSGSVHVANDGNVADDFTITLSPDYGPVDCGGGIAGAHLAVGGSVDCTWLTTSLTTADTPTVTATAVITGFEDPAYDDADTVSWGSPVNETNKDTTLSDPRLGLTNIPVSAPAGYHQSHSEDFTWAGAACGNAVVTNMASLATGASDSASFNIHRQCVTFKGDTAWAKGTTAATAGGVYNKTKGSWATYVKGQTGTYQLFAGQTKPAGTVTIGAGGVVTVNLANGFQFAPGTGNIHIQGYSTPPSGNPSPGLFAFNKTCAASPCSPGSVVLSNYYGIHLAVGVWTPDPNFGP